jgi:DnaD/phage-associated family protein
MAWIESHQELARHPKTKRLARALETSVPAAIGHLHLFWWWAMDYAQDGSLARYDTGEIADAAQWEGDPQAFVGAMLEAGFLDQDDAGALAIHDWDDYAGRLIEKRRQNAERVRTYRERNANVTRTKPARNIATVPNRTVPDSTSSTPLTPLTGETDTTATTGRAEVIESLLPAIQFFENNVHPGVSPTEVDSLCDYQTQGMSLDVLIEAMKRAVEAGPDKTNMAYIKGILNRWAGARVKTVADVEKLDRLRQSARAEPDTPPPEKVPVNQENSRRLTELVQTLAKKLEVPV